MGLDLGSRRIGVAVSDELALTAQGVKTILRKSREEDLKEILSLVTDYAIGKFVVGLPKNMNGSLGKQAEKTLEWARVVLSSAGIAESSHSTIINNSQKLVDRTA